MKDTCVIFGSFDDGSREEFDWTRQDCDLWAFNEAISKNHWVHWCTGVLQMHLPSIWKNPLNRNDSKHLEWLKTNDAIPVFMLEDFPDVPMAQKYPLDEIVSALLPHFERDKNLVWDDRGMYATSSLAYGVALAIYKGYKRLELWGIGLAMNTEYVYQRPGAMFWIGYALGRGIEVKLRGQMFDAPLYGYQGDLFIELAVFEQRIEELKALLPPAENLYNERRVGILEKVDAWKDKKTPGEEVIQALLNMVEAMADLYRVLAVIDENQRYVDKAHEMLKAAEDFRFSRSEFEARRNHYRKLCQRIQQGRAAQRLVVDKLFDSVEKADGYKKRCRTIDEFMTAYNADLELVKQLAGSDSQSTENIRYIHMLDEQYRAAGMSKHDEKAGGEEAEWQQDEP